MQNNGNKLRAFIITFIIMSVLIAAGYFVYTKINTKNDTKGDSMVKKFTSLFGTSKNQPADNIKDVNLQNNDTDKDQTTGDTTSSGISQTYGAGDSPNTNPQNTNTDPNKTNTQTPKLNPFPYSGSGSYSGSILSGGGFSGGGYTGGGSGFTGGGYTGGGGGYTGGGAVTLTKTQCNDGLDNDGDGKKDIADPGCHTDSKASNVSSYFAGWDDERSDSDFTQEDEKNKTKCEVNITFDDEDKKRLDELTRMFYKIAPYLATDEDIKLEVANRKSYENIISRSKEYTAQCYKERANLGPSRSLSNGGSYMLESKKNGYENTSKVTPSDTFLPGDKGVSFAKPYITLASSSQNSYFKDFNGDLIINHAIIKAKDRGQGSAAVAAHILQTMHDLGIAKKYIPGSISIPQDVLTINNAAKINEFKSSNENYEKLLKLLLRETGAYLETLDPGRQEWKDRKGGDDLPTFIGFVSEEESDYWGYVNVKMILNLYLASGANDNERKVDFGSTTWITGKQTEYETKQINDYEAFEKVFEIW